MTANTASTLTIPIDGPLPTGWDRWDTSACFSQAGTSLWANGVPCTFVVLTDSTGTVTVYTEVAALPDIVYVTAAAPSNTAPTVGTSTVIVAAPTSSLEPIPAPTSTAAALTSVTAATTQLPSSTSLSTSSIAQTIQDASSAEALFSSIPQLSQYSSSAKPSTSSIPQSGLGSSSVRQTSASYALRPSTTLTRLMSLTSISKNDPSNLTISSTSATASLSPTAGNISLPSKVSLTVPATVAIGIGGGFALLLLLAAILSLISCLRRGRSKLSAGRQSFDLIGVEQEIEKKVWLAMRKARGEDVVEEESWQFPRFDAVELGCGRSDDSRVSSMRGHY